LGNIGKDGKTPIHVFLHQKTSWWSFFLNFFILLCFFYFIYLNVSSYGNNNINKALNTKINLSQSDQKFDDVIGNDEAKEDLRDIVEFLKDPAKFKNVKVPKGVLMIGPPGTGKTLLARALAGEAGVPFISASGSEFEEVFVGLGAKRIRALFEEARKRAPCIIFIDEIDALGGERHMVFNRTQMSVNQLLVELDGFNPSEGVIVIGATNLPEVLDQALVRPGRFDRKVYLNLPAMTERKSILEFYMKKFDYSDDIKFDVLASQTPGFSGADLENMVNWSAMEATKKDMKINMELLEFSLMNIAMGRERKSLVLSTESKKLTAYHESGHAIVALFTEGSNEIRKATLIPRGQALGMVNFLPGEDPLMTKKQMLALMDTAMGGRAAEELIYGQDYVTQGASSDFHNATQIANHMISEMGMSVKLGHIYISEKDMSIISSDTKSIIESEVKRFLEESYRRAFDLLKYHQKELHLLAEALIKYETLELDEIKKIIRGERLINRDESLKKKIKKEESLIEDTKKQEPLIEKKVFININVLFINIKILNKQKKR